MIGNDVVDLAQSRRESNWKRKGFLDKLFTLQEQSVIKNATDPELVVWLLWSMKEAAYKIYNRETGLRAFMPQRLHCTINLCENANYYGKVVCGTDVYTTQTTIADEMIHTIALPEKHADKRVVFINQPVHKDMRGLPFIRNNYGKIIAVSKSHHGRYTRVVAMQDMVKT